MLTIGDFARTDVFRPDPALLAPSAGDARLSAQWRAWLRNSLISSALLWL